MLVLPQGGFTVTDTYTTNQYGEVKLAVGDRPLIQPTEVALPGTPRPRPSRPTTPRAPSRSTTGNRRTSSRQPVDARAVPLERGPGDGGRSGRVHEARRPRLPQRRVEVPAHRRVTGETPTPTSRSPSRTSATDAPLEVGGDVKLASFNVLNYFTTTGDSIPGCTFYRDRAGARSR